MRLLTYLLLASAVAGQTTPEERAVALVSEMTLDEKVLQMQNSAPAILRLGVPDYEWWNEALHGVARAGLATVFPQAIGLAATWDTDLMHRIADAISTEARAKFNEAQRIGDHSRYHGLTFWSPNINIFRDPRWGRGQETYGEDPYLTSRMAVAFITGMQGNDPNHPRTIATAKHFAVHSGPEPLRHTFDAHASEQDLENTYLPAFRASVTGAGVGSIMCAYNSVNGVPACANTDLLGTRLRQQWGFQGYVVSDCGAITDIAIGHAYTLTITEAAAKAVQAGTDLSCGSEFSSLGDAVRSGLVPESAIDRSLQRLFAARFRLGMFDAPNQVPFSEVDTPAHWQLALEAAEKSIVLLKNAGNLLPITAGTQRIAVIGPGANTPDQLLANYNGIPSKIVTPLEGMRQRFGESNINFALGSTFTAYSPALVPVPGFIAEYFDNADLAGAPKLIRPEAQIYFNWDSHDPEVAAQIPRDQFSVRWTGSLVAPYTGEYVLGIARSNCNDCTGTDSARLSVDGNLLIGDQTPVNSPRRTQQGVVRWTAGDTHQIQIEYRQTRGGVGIEFAWIPPADGMLAEALSIVNNSDVAVLFLGLNSDLEGEESDLEIPGFYHGDRTDIQLPQQQQRLLKACLATGKPVVVVLMTGSAVPIEGADAILEAWYGGEESGTAIARTLAGDNNPAGRLPVTFYRSVDQLPAFDDYSMAGRTYRYFRGTPLYPFGFGLSYSTFSYSATQVSGLRATARVTNTSKRDGDEVAQLYVGGELKGFERIHLAGGERRVVRFLLTPGSNGVVAIGGAQPLPLLNQPDLGNLRTAPRPAQARLPRNAQP